MDADERLTALKKGYADIILNTAKEAAAKVMVSERKALRFQRELLVSKDDALRMLLRLKGMMDSKVREAEMTSLNQQRKIEELEAQLQEAEDIVKDLREELGEVQSQLEKVTNDRLQHFGECDTTLRKETSEENRLNTSQSVISPESRHGYLAVCNMKNSELSQRNEGCQCCSANGSSMGIPYTCNRDLPSIITRSKEPELYRNGCTQRVRASERNLLDRELSVSGQIDEIEDATRVKKDEDGHEICVKPPQKAERICNIEKKAVHAGSSWYKVQGVRSFHRKRKRAARYKKNITPSFRYPLGQVVKENLVTEISCVKSHPNSIPNNAQSGEGHSERAPSLDISVMGRESGCLEVTESETEFGKDGSVQKTVSGDKELLDKPMLAKEASGSPGSSGIHVCKIDNGKVEVSSENLEIKNSETFNGIPCQPVNDRIIKYTFQRKRKRESLRNSDGHASLEKSNLMAKNEENPNVPLEPHNSSSINESSRDSRRLAQVARQLISLSEKKWWQ